MSKIIGSFADFTSSFDSFLFYRNELHLEHCLLVSVPRALQLAEGYTYDQLNRDILANKDLYVWEADSDFYWPNDNMFSPNNAVHGLSGFRVRARGGV